MINNMFNVIGKKNNQTLVSDADREIPTLGLTDNAENSITTFLLLSVYPWVLIFRSAAETDVPFFIFAYCII